MSVFVVSRLRLHTSMCMQSLGIHVKCTVYGVQAWYGWNVQSNAHVEKQVSVKIVAMPPQTPKHYFEEFRTEHVFFRTAYLWKKHDAMRYVTMATEHLHLLLFFRVEFCTCFDHNRCQVKFYYFSAHRTRLHEKDMSANGFFYSTTKFFISQIKSRHCF